MNMHEPFCVDKCALELLSTSHVHQHHCHQQLAHPHGHTQTHTDTVHTSSKCIQTWAQCLCVITYRGLNTCEHHAHADTHTVYNHTHPASNWLNNTLSVEEHYLPHMCLPLMCVTSSLLAYVPSQHIQSWQNTPNLGKDCGPLAEWGNNPKTPPACSQRCEGDVVGPHRPQHSRTSLSVEAHPLESQTPL